MGMQQGFARQAPMQPQNFMQQPLGNSAPVMSTIGGYSPRSQGYVPPVTQQGNAVNPSVQNAAYLNVTPGQAPTMGFSPQQPMQGYAQVGVPQVNPMFAQPPAPNAMPQAPVFTYSTPASPPRQHEKLDADKLWKAFLFGLLPVLFVACLLLPGTMSALRYVFVGLCVCGLGAMWYRQMFTSSTRMIVSVVSVIMCIVAIALTMQGNNDAQRTNANANVQSQQSTPVPSEDPSAALVAATDEVGEPTATPSAPSEAQQRLETFMNLWMGMNTPEMVSFVQPSWASAQDNPSAQLFTVLANRTPEAFTIEDISGTDADNSRTVTMTATINKNNGKDPIIYRFMVLMVKEGGEWYVDPNSLATNDEVKTSDENVVNDSSTSGLMTMAPRTTVSPAPSGDTKLYYNPDGGSYYHIDPSCSSVRSEYLPLGGSFLYSELATYKKEKNLQPCLVCGAPTQTMDTSSGT